VLQVNNFLESVSDRSSGKIPTALLSTDPDAATYVTVTDHFAKNQQGGKNRAFVSLASSTGSNLKALLKSINHQATSRPVGLDDDDDEVATAKKGPRLLNYDLQLLAEHVQERHLEQVIIAIGETEAFDSHLLSELIEYLGYWNNRVPFVLLMSIATSIDSLQQRLSRSAIRCLDGQLIDLTTGDDERERTVEALVQDEPLVWIGADLLSLMLERQSDYIQSNESLVRAVRYEYMSLYYANALTMFLIPNIKLSDIPSDHFEALRNVNSFRAYCRSLLNWKQTSDLRDLLDSDEQLFELAISSIESLRHQLSDMMAMLHFIQDLQRALNQETTFSKLYTLALSGRLTVDSTFIRIMLLSLRKASSSTIAKAMMSHVWLPSAARTQLDKMQTELVRLERKATDDNQELRSEFAVGNETLRTTVVAQKVELSRVKAGLGKRDEAYTDLLKRLTGLLEDLFKETLIDPRTMLFHELVIYDLRSPFRETFTPRPRHAIERALASPHDYLDCECCGPEGGAQIDDSTLAACQPVTAVLYQLYLESGGLINVSDLRLAFEAVLGENGRSEEENMALFQRALAEMRYLGFVKMTRKRVDHVAKVAWKGL
jgi:origin recognition complex subunit 3